MQLQNSRLQEQKNVIQQLKRQLERENQGELHRDSNLKPSMSMKRARLCRSVSDLEDQHTILYANHRNVRRPRDIKKRQRRKSISGDFE